MRNRHNDIHLCNRWGFTLAEVLITLGIIGVIAAITIPTLIQNAQDAQTKAGVKAAYSIISQAMTDAQGANGGTIKGICEIWNNVCFKNMFKPYLAYTKECDSNLITNGCWAQSQLMDGTIDDWFAINGSALKLKNGMYIGFRWHYENCDYPGDSTTMNNTCGWIAVDINGDKQPNRVGKDVFGFHVQDGKILPYGITGDFANNLTCNKTDTGSQAGWGCTYKYLYLN